jgi:hypothetical protein
VGTTAGAYDKGMVRLRSDVSGATGIMEIGEISEITWANDDYLTVVIEPALAARHLRILTDKTVLMDYDIIYTDQHGYPNPIPVWGPSLIPTWLTGSTVRVQFDAGDSWTLDGGALTYAWAFPGSSANGGLTGATTWADYDATGEYRVKCTVTRDYGGGHVKSTPSYRFVKVYSTASPPITEFSLDQCAGSWGDRGWTWKVTLYGDDAAISVIRDRAWVVLFARDFYGATEISMGPIVDRENIVAQGWIAGETIKMDLEQGAVTFEVRHPMWWLLQMRGFPTGLEDVQVAPTVWTQFEDLTLRKGLWEFIFWRTTLPAILDVQLTDDATGISIFNASPGTLGAQIISEANNTIRAYPCCDRLGRLYVQKEMQLIPESERGGIPIVQDVELQDLRRPFSLTRTVVNKVGQIDLTGMFYADKDHQPFFSLSPGHVFNWLGANIERADQLALPNQAKANELAGLFMGWRNITYPDVPLPMASNYRMADVTPHQYMTLALDAGDTLRDIALALTLVLRSVSFRYDSATGQLLTDIKGEETSKAEQNMIGDIPPNPPDVPDPDYPPPDWPPLPDLEPGWPTIAFVAGLDKGVYRGAGDFDPTNSNQPVWEAINDSLPTLDVTHFGIAAGLTGDKQQVCRLDTDGQIYTRDTDISDNWGVSLSNATVQGDLTATATIESMGVDPTTGRIWVYCYDVNGPGAFKHWVYYSDNWGVSWSGPNAFDHSTERDDDLQGAGMVGGLGSICWASNWTTLYGTYVWYGPSNGTGPWLIPAPIWVTAYIPPVFVHPAGDGLKAYSNTTGTYISEFRTGDGDGAPMVQLETDGLWGYATDATDQRWGSMWGSWSDEDFMRCFTRFGGALWQRIAQTDDNWATYSFSPQLQSILGTADIVALAPVVQEADEDMFAFACVSLGVPATPTYHAIYTMYGLAGTPVGKAGGSPQGAPFTDSIPYDLGTVAKGGIQFVRGS